MVEYANQYHKVELFKPLDMWSLLHQSIQNRFPDIFLLVELMSLCSLFQCYSRTIL